MVPYELLIWAGSMTHWTATYKILAKSLVWGVCVIAHLETNEICLTLQSPVGPQFF